MARHASATDRLWSPWLRGGALGWLALQVVTGLVVPTRLAVIIVVSDAAVTVAMGIALGSHGLWKQAGILNPLAAVLLAASVDIPTFLIGPQTPYWRTHASMDAILVVAVDLFLVIAFSAVFWLGAGVGGAVRRKEKETTQ
jgi:hypothetical protein